MTIAAASLETPPSLVERVAHFVQIKRALNLVHKPVLKLGRLQRTAVQVRECHPFRTILRHERSMLRAVQMHVFVPSCTCSFECK